MTESTLHASDDILFGLDAGKLRAVRESRLAATLDRIFSSHAHYRARFAELDIRRADIRTLEDLRQLPITS